MRIAIIVDVFPTLSQTFVLNQITGLLDMGHDVDIYAKWRGQRDDVLQPDVLHYNLLDKTHYIRRLPKSWSGKVKVALRSFASAAPKAPNLVVRAAKSCLYGLTLDPIVVSDAFVGRAPYDIAHCQFGTVGDIGIILKACALTRKLVVSFRGYDFSSAPKIYGTGMYADVFNAADAVTVVSESARTNVIELGCPQHLLVKHYSGTDTKVFDYKERSFASDKRIQILTVGRLVEKKGFKYAIQAVSKVIQNGASKIFYSIVGEGPLLDDLQGFVNSIGMEDRIEFLGAQHRNRILELMYASDIFLLPSVTADDGDMEGIPGSLREAMSTGMPVLSTWHSGIPELVKDGESGFLVPQRDVDALVDRLTYLIEHPEVWSTMGYAGRKQVEQCFDIYKMNLNLVAMYEHLLRGER